MKIYISYLLTAVLTSLLILFYLGVSAGFANYVPVLALLGSIILFVIAAPIYVFHQRAGMIVGIVSCLLILPYGLMFINKLLFNYDGRLQWGLIIILLPSILVLLSSYLSVKSLLKRGTIRDSVPINRTVRVLLSGTPILIFILYILFFGKYWSMDMFQL